MIGFVGLARPTCTSTHVYRADKVATKAGVGDHLRRLLSGIRESLKQMVFNRDLATTTFLLGVVWIGVALAYYGIILLGVEVFADKNNVCTDDDSAKISGNDFKDVFITSLGEVREQPLMQTV